MTMGDRIRKLRLAAGWTQQELAERAGLSLTTISKLERNHMEPSRVSTVQRLATALGCSVPHLLYGPRGWLDRLRDRWPVLTSLRQPCTISEKVDVPIEERPFKPDQQLADALVGQLVKDYSEERGDE